MMDVDEALRNADAIDDMYAVPTVSGVLAAEVRRLRGELARFGPLPLEATFMFDGAPEQLMFRRPGGELVVLTRMLDRDA